MDETDKQKVPVKAVTKAEALRVLPICLTTLDKLIREGRLGVVRVGRRVLIPVADIDALIEGRQ